MQKGQPEVACLTSDLSLYRQWDDRTHHEGILAIPDQFLSSNVDVFRQTNK